MSTTKLSCDICTIDYCDVIKRHRNKVCQYECGFSACFICLEKCLTGYNKIKPTCVQCAKEWTRDFLKENTTVKWFTTIWVPYQTDLLVEREIAQLPATQPAVNYELKCRKLKSQVVETDEEINELMAQINRLKHKRTGLQFELHNKVESKVEEVQGRPCPLDECKGYLSSQWKCQICSTWFCPDCHVVKSSRTDEEHICNVDTVASIKFIATDSRACPQCHINIHKIDGCDQMWCVKCHTAFSYRTGRRETGVVHNPEYYRWQREQNNGVAPRVAGDNPNGCFNEILLIRKIGILFRQNAIIRTDNDILLESIRLIPHIRMVILPHYLLRDTTITRTQYRVSYMLNELTKEDLFSNVKRHEKQIQATKELHDIYEMCMTALTDIFNEANINENWVNTIIQLKELFNYTTISANRVRKDYTLSNVYVFDKFRFTSYTDIKKTEKANKLLEEQRGEAKTVA